MALEASPLRTLGWKVLICWYRFVNGKACVMLAGHLHQESLDSCWGRWSISGLYTGFICQSKFSLKCIVYFEGQIVVVVSKTIKLHWNVPFCSSVVTEMAYQQKWLTQKMRFFFSLNEAHNLYEIALEAASASILFLIWNSAHKSILRGRSQRAELEAGTWVLHIMAALLGLSATLVLLRCRREIKSRVVSEPLYWNFLLLEAKPEPNLKVYSANFNSISHSVIYFPSLKWMGTTLRYF